MAELASLMYEKGDLRRAEHKVLGLIVFSIAVTFSILAILRVTGRAFGWVLAAAGASGKISDLGLGDLLWFTIDWMFVALLLAFIFIVKFLKDMTRLGEHFLTGEHTPLGTNVYSTDVITGASTAFFDAIFAASNLVFARSAVKNWQAVTNAAIIAILAIAVYIVTVVA